MVKTQQKQNTTKTTTQQNKGNIDTVQVTDTNQTVQGYFLQYVQKNGYTLKHYNQLAEKSVQYNGKIKLYFVPLKNGNLKLCLHGVQLPKNTDNIQGLQVIPNQNTYPNKYCQRIYFKGCKLTDVQTILDNLLVQVLPKIDNVTT